LAASGAWAGDSRSEMQITPILGYSHLRIDGTYLESGVTNRLDQLLAGANIGVLTPFNVVIEAGTARAIHEDWFSSNDFDFDTDYAAIATSSTLPKGGDSCRRWAA